MISLLMCLELRGKLHVVGVDLLLELVKTLRGNLCLRKVEDTAFGLIQGYYLAESDQE